MTPTTYLDLQAAPRAARPQDARSRQALQEAADHLGHAAQQLVRGTPDYREALSHALQSIRLAYTGLLTWHSRPPRPDAALAELSYPAEQLVGALRVYRHRALPLEALATHFPDALHPSVEARESVQMSYYVARDTLGAVLSSLPETVTREAVQSLHAAQAILTGRLRRVPQQSSEAPPADAKQFSAPPVATA